MVIIKWPTISFSSIATFIMIFSKSKDYFNNVLHSKIHINHHKFK